LVVKTNKQELLKGLLLGLITISILSSVYYLNTNSNQKEDPIGNDYLKSEICYYALQGIKSDYHYHLQLNITINGERIEIPTNIGFEKDENGDTLFLHPIHTYDNSGRIHVETTRNATAELGFLFDIWGEDFSRNKILDYNVDEEHIIEMTMNGESVDTFENTILEPYVFIDINYKNKN
tara:strand:- start:15 stop:551 length:537 start_codon:yes stop_codon:yes gene_type:complete